MLLKSPEDGLRFHKSMDADDMFEGPLDLMPFGKPVVGAVSTDELWVINPQAYDPTVPSKNESQKGDTPESRRLLNGASPSHCEIGGTQKGDTLNDRNLLSSRAQADDANERQDLPICGTQTGETLLRQDLLTPSASAKVYGEYTCLLYTSPSPRDGLLSRMPSSA